MDLPVESFNQDPITHLSNQHLDETKRRCDRLIAVEKKLCSAHPSEYLSEIECKLRRNMKQRDQLLGCQTGSASKLKEVILGGAIIHNELPNFINNTEQIENVKPTDCLKQELCTLKLNLEKLKKHIALIDNLLE